MAITDSTHQGQNFTNPKYTEEELQALLLQQLTTDNPDYKLSNAALVQLTGWSERSLRRRKAKLKQQLTAPLSQPNSTLNDPSAPNTELPEPPHGAFATKGKISNYEPGVGWRSTEFQYTEPDTTAILKLEDVLGPFETQRQPQYECHRVTSNKTFVIALSDLQAGKTDELGGTANLSKRLDSVMNQIESHLEQQEETYAEIVLVDTGDILEGFSNTISQQQTNDLSLTDQIRYAQRVVVEAIKRFAPHSPKFTYVAVPSNHCAVRTGVGSKNRSNAPNDDWGLLIQENISLALESHSDPVLNSITYVRPSKWEETVTHTTQDGTTLAVCHGHQFGPGKAPEFMAKMVLGKRSNMHNADVLLYGHHHSFSISLAGAGQFVIGAPTIDNGSAWFSNNTGISSPASMLTFTLSNHLAQDWMVVYP